MEPEIFAGIAEQNREREAAVLSSYACPSDRGIRRHPEREKVPDPVNFRPVFFHDSDRIIHSLAYSRYVDKTQVFSFFENDHITHRALHVQLVSRIGRVIGRALKLNEDLIEAIALGHDIGHTPFGHEGERILDQICSEHGIGHFAHNAQSVRFLMEVENRGLGFNLSLQVLDGILCHNGELIQEDYKPAGVKSWEGFDREYRACFEEEGASKNLFPMTLEGCVVRVADVIAYIGRDFEDAIRVHLIRREEMPDEVSRVMGTTNAEIINTLVRDLISNSIGRDGLAFSKEVYRALDRLLAFNYRSIYTNERIKSEQPKIRNMFESLFLYFSEHFGKREAGCGLLNHFLDGMEKRYLESNDPRRIIIDFMAGMTDDFLYNQYVRLFVPTRKGYHFE